MVTPAKWGAWSFLYFVFTSLMCSLILGYSELHQDSSNQPQETRERRHKWLGVLLFNAAFVKSSQVGRALVS